MPRDDTIGEYDLNGRSTPTLESDNPAEDTSFGIFNHTIDD